MRDHSPQSDLDWLAFQFVTRSLSESDCDDFERQLLESQECREAVARAVELTLAAEFACRSSGAEAKVELVQPDSARPEDSGRRARRGRRWAWSVIAASLAFFIGWQASLWFFGRGAVNGPGVAESERQPADSLGVAGRDLALAWDQTRRTFTLADLDQEFAPLMGAGPDADLSDEPDDAPAVVADVEAPSWMLAAVAGMQRRVLSDDASPEGAARPPADAAAPSQTRDEG